MASPTGEAQHRRLDSLQPGECRLASTASHRNIRILFLDVDGVLNTFADCTSSRAIVSAGWPCPLSLPLLKRLQRVLVRTGASIVLSSAWRTDREGLRALAHGFSVAGIDERRVVGATPLILGSRRALEIAGWLEAHGGSCSTWAAVDDLDLWSEAPRIMEGHAVRTYRKTGLTVEAAREIVSYLLADGDSAAASREPAADKARTEQAMQAAKALSCLNDREDVTPQPISTRNHIATTA